MCLKFHVDTIKQGVAELIKYYVQSCMYVVSFTKTAVLLGLVVCSNGLYIK